jgi:hypothetical protein
LTANGPTNIVNAIAKDPAHATGIRRKKGKKFVYSPLYVSVTQKTPDIWYFGFQ